jgi:RNase P subunit RPR2
MAYGFYNTHFECKFCGKPSELACDHCGRFICDNHAIEKRVENAYPDSIFCPDCFKTGRFQIRIFKVGKHESILNMSGPH